MNYPLVPYAAYAVHPHYAVAGQAGYNIGYQHPATLPREVAANYRDYPQEIWPALRGTPGYNIGYAQPAPGDALAAYRAMMGQPPVSFQLPTMYRKYPVGFDSGTEIAPGATFTVSTQIQVPFRGKRLLLNPSNATAWIINQVLVGVQLQGPALAAFPGAGFTPESLIALQLDTADRGNFINIQGLNRTQGGVRFQAGMIGDVYK